MLNVPSLHLEDGSTSDDEDAIRAELGDLAAWLKLDRVRVERVVRGA